jgi:hypothetical protein
MSDPKAYSDLGPCQENPAPTPYTAGRHQRRHVRRLRNARSRSTLCSMATHWIRKHLMAPQRQAAPLVAEPEEPPVVGALEDVANGESAAIEARGSTPAMLAASLLKSLLATPLLGKVLQHRRRLGR